MVIRGPEKHPIAIESELNCRSQNYLIESVIDSDDFLVRSFRWGISIRKKNDNPEEKQTESMETRILGRPQAVN